MGSPAPIVSPGLAIRCSPEKTLPAKISAWARVRLSQRPMSTRVLIHPGLWSASLARPACALGSPGMSQDEVSVCPPALPPPTPRPPLSCIGTSSSFITHQPFVTTRIGGGVLADPAAYGAARRGSARRQEAVRPGGSALGFRHGNEPCSTDHQDSGRRSHATTRSVSTTETMIARPATARRNSRRLLMRRLCVVPNEHIAPPASSLSVAQRQRTLPLETPARGSCALPRSAQAHRSAAGFPVKRS